MICAMKVISVGFDMDAAAASAAAASAAAACKSSPEEEGEDRFSGRGEARGRAVRKTVKSSGGGGGSQANKGGESASSGDEKRTGSEPDAIDDLVNMPGWFEFAGGL